MLFKALIALLLAALSFADVDFGEHTSRSPTKGNGSKAIKYSARFDDLPSSLRRQIMVYRDLYFRGFEAYSPRSGGLTPQSQPNAAVTFPPRNRVAALQLAQNTSSFDLRSFYFGCVVYDLDTRRPTTTPRKCSVTIKGSSSIKTIRPVSQLFVFQPDRSPSPMTKAVLNDNFSDNNITQIVFTFGDESGNSTGTALLTDNYIYTAYVPTK